MSGSVGVGRVCRIVTDRCARFQAAPAEWAARRLLYPARVAEAEEDPVAQAHGELSLARIALAEDDLEHAANHLAGAIAWAPALPEVHELLAALATRAGDGVAGLFPLEEPAYIGTVVARAHLLSRTSPVEALRLLAQATRFDPAQPWADVSWVRALDVARLDPDELARLTVGVMQPLGDPAGPEVARANEVYLDLVRRATVAHPGHALLHGAAAGLARRFPGHTAEAVRWGARGHKLHADKLTAVWYAYALRADGRLNEALKVMRAAWKAAPGEMDLCADMANWLAEAGRLDEALELLDTATRTAPDYDCAVHTAARLRFAYDGDVRHLVALADFMREHPVTSHEHADLDEACRERRWLGAVAGPAEACVNVLHQLAAEDRGPMAHLSLSALEVPSALALLRRASPGIEVEITGPPPADMVAPLRPGRALWRYDALDAYPTVEPAARASQELLARVAAPAWPHPIAAYDHALPLGQLPVEELLSLLVHPPAAPDGWPMAQGWWERSAQTFACLGLLHCEELRAGAAPGDTARARALLTEIAYGVEDWTTDTACFALAVAAWLDPACREDVVAAVGYRFLAAVQASRQRAVTIRDSLAEVVLMTPDMVPDVVGLARDVLGRGPAPAAPAPAKPPKKRRFFQR
ncbi:hypothetical protein GCM10007977_092420 [Dactylosporangium sucinum]|uniref:Tetratricopeptide repeat protein n=1 Tax=Dactylosporangium sucinum TaxID=1424081 RepID=A0A917UBG2_9ACTN|nr:hypothetical protein GCM10007977_092420 [Dactylosporangium sucinum]